MPCEHPAERLQHRARRPLPQTPALGVVRLRALPTKTRATPPPPTHVQPSSSSWSSLLKVSIYTMLLALIIISTCQVPTWQTVSVPCTTRSAAPRPLRPEPSHRTAVPSRNPTPLPHSTQLWRVKTWLTESKYQHITRPGSCAVLHALSPISNALLPRCAAALCCRRRPMAGSSTSSGTSEPFSDRYSLPYATSVL